MKYMDQSLFDVLALMLAHYKRLGDEIYEQARAGIWEGYGESFKGDDLWLRQAEEAASSILLKFPPGQWGEFYEAASQYRRRLDHEMKPPSWISRIAGGTMFMRSHPEPQNRVILCERNALLCLTVSMTAPVHLLRENR